MTSHGPSRPPRAPLDVARFTPGLCHAPGAIRRSRWIAAGISLLCLIAPACRDSPRGLRLTVLDAESGEVTPARIELVDEDDEPRIADDALQVAGDCGWLPAHNWVPGLASLQMKRALRRYVDDPFAGTRQFYLNRPVTIDLEPGRYRLRAFKGLEYRVAEHDVVVGDGGITELRVELTRWIDLPAEGWYGADDHLHIARPNASFDARISAWMRAEDLHVANLLQMGLARAYHITPQHGFGPETVHRHGDTLLASGQENPRTHVLGHAIVLGAREWIDFPDSYLAYDRVWREAHEQGGVNGYAHWGVGGADEGIAVWAHEELIDFVEVFGFGLPYYEMWYDMLNLGLRITPTAGSDYPCGPTLPGRERFYTRVDGRLTWESWLEAVRDGRTFITNGPALDFRVEDESVGNVIYLDGPRTVTVEARARFDPHRDDVMRLELIGAGDVLRTATKRTASGEIRSSWTVEVGESTWLALRCSGSKLGETPVDFAGFLESALSYVERSGNDLLRDAIPRDGTPRPSAAHTAPIWVAVRDTPAIAEQHRALEVARRMLGRLDELQARFADECIGDLAGFPGRGDGVGEEELLAGRPVLLKAIRKARELYAGEDR